MHPVPDRIQRLPQQYFAALLARVAEAARRPGAPIIDLGRGNPDVPPPPDVAARLAEVAALSRTSDLGEGAMIAETLTTFSNQSLLASDLLLSDYAENGDEVSIEELREFTSTSMETLAELEALLPDEAHDELVYAAQVLGDIDAAAGRACPACTGGIEQIPPVLMSASQVSERPVTVVPAPLVQEGRPSTDGGPRKSGDQGPKQNGGPEDDGDPLTEPPIAPDPADTDTDTDTDAGTGDDPTNPLDVLTEPVTGQGGGQTSNGGGLPGVPEVDDVIDSVDDSLPEVP